MTRRKRAKPEQHLPISFEAKPPVQESVRLLLKLAARVAIFALLLGGIFGAAIFGVPTVYYRWMQYQCWRAGPDSDACWWFDLLKHPDRPREGGAAGQRR